MGSALALVLRKADVSGDIHRAHQDQILGELVHLVCDSPGMLLLDLASILLTEQRLYSADDSSLREIYYKRHNYELTKERKRFIELIEAVYGVEDENYLNVLRGVALERLVLELVRPRYCGRDEECLHNAEVDRVDGSEVSEGSVDVAAWSQLLEKGEFYECKIAGDVKEHQIAILERLEACCVEGNARYAIGICSLQRQWLLKQRVADSHPNISANIVLFGVKRLAHLACEIAA